MVGQEYGTVVLANGCGIDINDMSMKKGAEAPFLFSSVNYYSLPISPVFKIRTGI
jgi:hypothetical protein